ncbi:hypothetical protein [Actinoplanes regularis]|uniref:hypothetical protein n=1 Tax=Actinoplanes regularis TaxID=52697 RepID=UPI00249FDE2E|nr:hypothetical protein [Actinoplanes regularis]GLW30436.1 hypothetical protein Areg01_33760 [Actinoplanes regularis]
MSDHWGGFDHHDDDGLPDFGDLHDLPDTHELHTPDLDSHDDFEHHDTPLAEHDDDGTGLDDLPQAHESLPAADDFPPTLEIGDLPEPVDGFPWVDSATLGSAEPYDPPVETVDPHDLAVYAGVEVPDGVDPWTVLTASDDPAVAALARWWTPDEQ